jgi:hypothetical protein
LLENADIEKNSALQNRITKACIYFAPKFENIIMQSMPEVGTDNKALMKSTSDLLERFGNEARVKHACLQYGTGGFQVAGFLETRARASIRSPGKTRKTTDKDLSDANIKHPELLKKIKQWRNDLAAAQGLSHYQIISRKAMFGIAGLLPVSRNELLEINGIGQKKVKQYGEELLEMISNYIRDNNISKTVDDTPLVIKKKPKKPDSKVLSYELFIEGKEIPEIAQERGLAVSTIEGHLSYFVGTGELPVDKLLSPEKLAKIKEYFIETEDLSLGPAKIVMGDEVSWGELRFVIRHLELEKTRF